MNIPALGIPALGIPDSPHNAEHAVAMIGADPPWMNVPCTIWGSLWAIRMTLC